MDARNALETYCYNMKQTIEDKLGDKLDEDDKEKVGPPACLTRRASCPAELHAAWHRHHQPCCLQHCIVCCA